ncbi:HD-GYP domain-containing protein [Alkalibacter saccharofermentans]|uniref:Diguanylate cyclase (GGDEF) domain-containing protein/HDIG domain-containing protein n=1 Tax=Alkalibacter saccharofermentans DSM 14828 TaxID=1120975 RepID=A0A1M4ZUW5_9FIRM|nr:diguanylate cyclase [Alkalibacter saccharofermentans]SHF21853.1 diguanylate cyclase (GGDEF) domain-containing protein/HDIG domain-containing protein [Alkalibacter saccharofermentans DSM 14828]
MGNRDYGKPYLVSGPIPDIDGLTGLYSRAYLDQVIKIWDENKIYPLSFLVFDINGLSLINEAYGFDVGDSILKQMAEIFKNECRTDDVIARYGGDEFAGVFAGAGEEEVAKIVKRLKGAIDKITLADSRISVSFGWETRQNLEEPFAHTVNAAREKMNRNKFTQKQSLRHKTIEIVIKILYEKNIREEKHSWRVSRLCVLIGRNLGLSVDDLNELRIVGLIHDIGKIAVDCRVLDKPDKLDSEEMDEIHTHAEVGFEILNSVKEFKKIAHYVRCHHERWDGTGYPSGLKGEEIPIQSRIIAIADAYDAMTNDRPYRKAMAEKEALEELVKYAGTQFDPNIIDILKERLGQGFIHLSEKI